MSQLSNRSQRSESSRVLRKLTAPRLSRTATRAAGFAVIAGVIGFSALAATIRTLPEVNAHIAQLLAPMNDANTQVELALLAASVTPDQLVELSAQGQIAKFGLKHDVTLRLERGTYLLGDGTAPTVDLDLIIAAKIADIFGQQAVNDIAPRLDEFAKDQAKAYLRRFGQAAKFDAQVHVTRDQLQNVQSVTLDLALQIDINALPSGVTSRDVDVLSAQARLEAGQQGARISAQVVLNGQGGFLQGGGAGLKAIVAGLLSGDPAADKQVENMVQMVNNLATALATTK